MRMKREGILTFLTGFFFSSFPKSKLINIDLISHTKAYFMEVAFADRELFQQENSS